MEKIQLKKIEVEYCDMCTMPFEFCEYSKTKCVKEVKKDKKDTDQNQKEDEKPSKQIKQKITLKILLHEKRNRGITEVSGFEDLKIDTKSLAKKLTKKLGCGSGTTTKNSFEMQGLYRDIMIKVLIKELKGLNLSEDNFKVDLKLKKTKKPRMIN